MCNKDGFNKNKGELLLVPIDLEMTNAYFCDGQSNATAFKEKMVKIMETNEHDTIVNI